MRDSFYLCGGGTHPFVDGKYGANRSQAVDVTGAIQWVKTDHILPLRVSKRNAFKLGKLHVEIHDLKY